MSRASIYKPAKKYVPKNLVSGFCVPTGENGKEALICWDCAANILETRGVTPVTFDGEIPCSLCGEFLQLAPQVVYMHSTEYPEARKPENWWSL
jgi:hypothetical protein